MLRARRGIVFFDLDLVVFLVILPAVFSVLIVLLLLGLFFLFHLGDVHVPLRLATAKFVLLVRNVKLDDIGLDVLELASVWSLLPCCSARSCLPRVASKLKIRHAASHNLINLLLQTAHVLLRKVWIILVEIQINLMHNCFRVFALIDPVRVCSDIWSELVRCLCLASSATIS